MSHRVLGLVAALVLWTGVATAQSIRSFSTARQAHGESQLRATVELAGASLRLGPGRADALYRLELRYDAERFRPVSRYAGATGDVALGLERIGSGGLRVPSTSQPTQGATIMLSPTIDLALVARLEAVNAELELGGLRLIELALQNGAARTVARFSRPNAVRCSRATFRAGAADFKVVGLGNSRCDEVTFQGGVGMVTLDFSGTWANDMRFEATLAAGNMTLRLPRGLGVRLATENFLALVEPEGFTQTDGAFLSENYDTATQYLDIILNTSLGRVAVEWLP